MERLVAGRERIYLDRFYNELSADPKTIDEATRNHYAALYARPHAMHDAFEQFAAFHQDAVDNKALLAKRRQAAHAGAGDRRGEILRHGAGGDAALRRRNVTRRHRARLRPLDHGGKPGRHRQAGDGFPEMRWAVLLLAGMAMAQAQTVSLQQDCRGQGTIGFARLSPDGLVLSVTLPQSAYAWKKGDPDFTRMVSHLGGILPGERKPVPPSASGDAARSRSPARSPRRSPPPRWRR